MYQFIKPHPLKLRPDLSRAETIDYYFETFLAETAWKYEKWKEEGWDEAQVRIGEAIEEAACGQPVRLSREDRDKLREALREVPIGGAHAPKIRGWAVMVRSMAKVPESAANATAKEAS